MKHIRFEPLVGNLRSNILGMHLSTFDNDAFCQMVFKGESDTYDNWYNQPLIYVVPVTDRDENTDSSNQDGNTTIVNLLMQLKAVQDKQNNMFHNNNLVKNNIIKQIKVQGESINSSSLKNQINLISKVANNTNIEEKEFNKTINLAIDTLKKKL